MYRFFFVCALAIVAMAPKPLWAAEFGPISELRAGLYGHDIGLVSNRKEPAELAGTGEVLFKRPTWRFENRFVNWFLTPRPHLGIYVPFGKGTTFGYAGVTWDVRVFGPFFFEFGFGGAVHNGNLDKSDPEMKALGTHLLFHEQISIGVELTQNLRVIASLHHISNGEINSRFNSGMDTAGVRIGYKF